MTCRRRTLRYRPYRPGFQLISSAVLYARFILVAVTLGVTTYGVYQMLQAVRFASMTFLQGTMIFFFAVSLGWIGFAAGSVLAGASKRRDPPSGASGGDLPLTALVMPIYNEDPTRTAAALQAMAEALEAEGVNDRFEVVIISDSTNADAWIRETLGVERLRAALHEIMPVWYRRRRQNIARKAGNVEDFVTRWGARYQHMIVLDADSLIDAPTLQRLVEMMQTDPDLGILQTAPQLIGAKTFFGRLQQFAACVYGPVISRGLAAWSGDSGNYWGHNAIIRVAAFAQHCGLPKLRGRQPFGGHVLSHDFVEAALMRRGGYKVRMATDCGGSWEESPPSLIDIAIRDRRWAQGNLQHMKILGTAGLRLVSRMHLSVGIMSYLSSPLWLVMIAIGFALTVQSHLIRPEYFNHDFQLFPTWPRFDVALMMALFWFSMVVLLIPKLLGFIRALASPRIRRGAGGVIGVSASVLLEAILSALYAPILMMIQSRHVFEVFMGRDSGWKPQRRDSGSTTWRDAWYFHRRHIDLERGHGRDCVFPVAFLVGLGFSRTARIVSGGAAIALQRQRRTGALSREIRTAAHPGRIAGTGAGCAPPGTVEGRRALAGGWAALSGAPPRSAAHPHQRQSSAASRPARPSGSERLHRGAEAHGRKIAGRSPAMAVGG